jgi:endonuclease YncB( thermonuclease family)
VSSVHPADIRKARAALTVSDYWRVRATILRIIDGDTLGLMLDLGWGIRVEPVEYVYVTHLRFLGYDAPEHNTEDGQKAITWLGEFLSPYGEDPLCWVVSAALDGRGRILGSLTMLDDGTDVIERMREAGWLRPYTGRGPKPW